MLAHVTRKSKTSKTNPPPKTYEDLRFKRVRVPVADLRQVASKEAVLADVIVSATETYRYIVIRFWAAGKT